MSLLDTLMKTGSEVSSKIDSEVAGMSSQVASALSQGMAQVQYDAQTSILGVSHKEVMEANINTERNHVKDYEIMS